jgi:nucleoside 2-deoxyribosyltransferase
VQATTRRGDATADSVAIEGDNVLAFGMVETTWTVEAKTLVIDPQHSSVDALIGASNAERISLILNEHEARNATGQSDVCRAATDLVERGVDSVVIKRGALGGLVARAGALDTFGAIPTATVQPLGSGDAFSAGYFHAWAAGEADPLAAAQFGAQIAAAHSLAGIPQISAELLTGLAEPLTYPRQTLPQIYLAGPFFSVAQRQFIRIVHDGLLHLGIGVFSPLLEIGCGGDEVAEKDLAGLAGCHSVLAILDGEDAGTLFEVGWATHAGIPVTGLAENPNDPAWTMARGTGAFVTADLATALYQSAWAAIRALTSW